MIEINLLPEELKVRRAKTSEQKQYFVYLIPLFVVILIFVHLYLGMVGISRALRLNSLNKKWTALEPQRKKIAGLKSQSELSSQEGNIIQELIKKSVIWSKNLNKLSLNLPSGIWFNEISISSKELVIRATVVSLEKNEVDLINKFMSNLKNDSDFLKDFTNLDLGAMQRKNIGSFEVVDFILTAAVKPK
jgi:Tfp pilus assembly protein PilN